MLAAIFCLIPAEISYGRRQSENNIAEKNSWAFLGGYGTSFRGFGGTRVRVETIDAILRYGHLLAKVGGDSWYRGRHDILFELPLSWVVEPDVSPMVGINFLACWTFTAPEQFIPYFFAGGGPLYTDAKIPGLGSKFNGNYQFGAGIRYPIDEKYYLNFECRYHHISNADTKAPNDPINSIKGLMGMTIFF